MFRVITTDGDERYANTHVAVEVTHVLNDGDMRSMVRLIAERKGVDFVRQIIDGLEKPEPADREIPVRSVWMVSVDGEDAEYVLGLIRADRAALAQLSGNAGELPGAGMSADRAAYFLRRFRRDEKMLGPNEQAAIDLALSALAAQAQSPGS